MNFSDIKYCDLVNGTGIGISLFVSGCNINCPGCFNKKAQNFNFGHPFNQDTMDSLLRGGCNNNIDHLSILGGEPLDKANYPEVLQIVKAWKAIHTSKPIWLWTGYNISEVEEYTKALAVKPDYFLAYLNRGSAYSELGKYDSAIADYTKVITLKPNDADAYYNTSNSLSIL